MNVTNVTYKTKWPEDDGKIQDMVSGQVGYTVPWAYRDEMLDENSTILAENFGTATLRVECVEPGLYSLTLEESTCQIRNRLRNRRKDQIETPPVSAALILGCATTIGLALGVFILTWLDTKSVAMCIDMLGKTVGLWVVALFLSTFFWAVCLSKCSDVP